jgi:hypothetical protein
MKPIYHGGRQEVAIFGAGPPTAARQTLIVSEARAVCKHHSPLILTSALSWL